MGNAREIEITPEMIEAATEAIRPYFDAFDSWLAPVLAKMAVEAAWQQGRGGHSFSAPS